ncbi:MAG: type II toxin-antitoxin system VapB family antitoxin [Calditrichaeota bacterium]|nr:MAG: type II toxin-antitoxin system VapB family antitoxin [Calditrichota bacterium]MBL1207857.1 type II toxin-antitoxin system VapB family antitoxin [Calditrichota bacterium]NOG47691.1 type II toxin-antitoxin system VapB family antitoxin [Calditrichota bacterium]
MRTTLDIPEELMNEAMSLTKSPSKTELIKMALSNIIQKNKIKSLKIYKGKIDLDIDLSTLRNRNEYSGR